MTIKETIEEAKKVGVQDMSWKAWFMIVTIISAAVVASYYGVNVTMNVDLNTRLSIVEGLLTQPINSTFYTLQKESNYIVSVVKSGATTYYTLQNGTDGTLQWYSTNKTALHVAAAGNLTDGGTIFCKNQTWTNTLTLLNTVMVIESYNGTWRTYSNQGKIMVPQLAADPNTSGWSQTEQGFEWYNTVEDTRKYWNGTTIVTFPSIGGGSVANGTYTLSQAWLVYQSGSTWYMENQNGAVPFSSTNASLVIANAIGNLTTGRTWQETVIMRGNATIYAPITLSDKNYTILDCYQARITLAANSNCNMINAITSTHHITIQGGDWDGNKANQGVVNLVGMNFQYVYNSTVRDTVVHDIQSNIAQDNSGVCYTLRNCDTVDLVGVQAFRSGKAGIAIMGGCRRIRVDRAFIKAVNSSHTDFYEGIVMYGGDTGSDSIQECTIENCYVEGIGHDPDGGQGIHLYQYCYHNLIANNIVNLTVYSSTGIGSRHNYCDYNSVIGNKIYNTAKNAVGISFCNSDNNQIVGNYIYGCDTGYKQERNADNNQVSSNYFFDCVGGLRILDNGGNYTMIVDNRFYDCDAYDTSIIAGLSTRAHDNLGSDGNWMVET